MIDPRVRSAALNNAEWCEAIAAAHGTPAVFHDGIWVNHHPLPRYYPNAVTLHEALHHDSGHAIDHIRDLARASLPRGWTVKDSFEMLDLGSAGFAPLFDARWVIRAPGAPAGNHPLPNWRWTTIETADGLAEFETGWSAAAGESPGQARVFPPRLLETQSVRVIAAFEDSRVVAGATVNRSRDVVGLTNLFAPRALEVASAVRILATLAELFPDLPVVGYANGAELKACVQLGYEVIGPLRVWISQASEVESPAED